MREGEVGVENKQWTITKTLLCLHFYSQATSFWAYRWVRKNWRKSLNSCEENKKKFDFLLLLLLLLFKLAWATKEESKERKKIKVLIYIKSESRRRRDLHVNQLIRLQLDIIILNDDEKLIEKKSIVCSKQKHLHIVMSADESKTRAFDFIDFSIN